MGVASINIERNEHQWIARCKCGWMHSQRVEPDQSFKLLRFDTAIARHERYGCLKNPCEGIDIIGGFNLVVLYDQKTQAWEGACCTCGWEHYCKPDEIRSAVEQHNKTHKNFMTIEKRYREGEFTFDNALHFAIMLGMPEQRADAWLDGMRSHV